MKCNFSTNYNKSVTQNGFRTSYNYNKITNLCNKNATTGSKILKITTTYSKVPIKLNNITDAHNTSSNKIKNYTLNLNKNFNTENQKYYKKADINAYNKNINLNPNIFPNKIYLSKKNTLEKLDNSRSQSIKTFLPYSSKKYANSVNTNVNNINKKIYDNKNSCISFNNSKIKIKSGYLNSNKNELKSKSQILRCNNIYTKFNVINNNIVYNSTVSKKCSSIKSINNLNLKKSNSYNTNKFCNINNVKIDINNKNNNIFNIKNINKRNSSLLCINKNKSIKLNSSIRLNKDKSCNTLNYKYSTSCSDNILPFNKNIVSNNKYNYNSNINNCKNYNSINKFDKNNNKNVKTKKIGITNIQIKKVVPSNKISNYKKLENKPNISQLILNKSCKNSDCIKIANNNILYNFKNNQTLIRNSRNSSLTKKSNSYNNFCFTNKYTSNIANHNNLKTKTSVLNNVKYSHLKKCKSSNSKHNNISTIISFKNNNNSLSRNNDNKNIKKNTTLKSFNNNQNKNHNKDTLISYNPNINVVKTNKLSTNFINEKCINIKNKMLINKKSYEIILNNTYNSFNNNYNYNNDFKLSIYDIKKVFNTKSAYYIKNKLLFSKINVFGVYLCNKNYKKNILLVNDTKKSLENKILVEDGVEFNKNLNEINNLKPDHIININIINNKIIIDNQYNNNIDNPYYFNNIVLKCKNNENSVKDFKIIKYNNINIKNKDYSSKECLNSINNQKNDVFEVITTLNISYLGKLFSRTKYTILNILKKTRLKSIFCSFLNIRDIFNLLITSKNLKLELCFILEQAILKKILYITPYQRELLWKSACKYNLLIKKIKYSCNLIDYNIANKLYNNYLFEALKERDEYTYIINNSNYETFDRDRFAKFTYINQIEKDVLRTFTKKNSKFYLNYETLNVYKDTSNQELNTKICNNLKFKLERILLAYSKYNKNIGYCQGINYITANILLILNEELDAFLFLDSIINKLNLENKIFGLKISSNLDNYLKKQIKAFSGKSLNKLSEYLKIHHLELDVITTPWILSLFSTYIEPTFLFKLWDILIIYGWNFLIAFCVSILNEYEVLICSWNSFAICNNIKNMLKTDLFNQSFEYIVLMSLKIIENNKNYNKITLTSNAITASNNNTK